MRLRVPRLELTAAGRARRSAVEEVRALPARPLISVVTPTYETDARHLQEAIDSVRNQHYPEWELCVADDGSRNPAVRALLEHAAASEPRIDTLFCERNGGISAATNAAMARCHGEFVAFLDHDDVLAPEALLRVAQALAVEPGLDVIYSDSDKLTAHGFRADPFFKPDWSPTYALGAMYIGHLLVVRRSVAEAAGGFDSSFDTIQDFEFMLRVSERTERIHHIPRTLYHWRAIPGSIAAGTDQKGSVAELQSRAVTEHLERLDVDAVAVPHPTIPHRVQLAAPPGEAPGSELGRGVSVVIPWSGDRGRLERLVGSLREVSAQPPGELIVVAPPGAEVPEGIEVGLRLVAGPGGDAGRGASCNAGAAAAAGEWLVFCADAAEVTEPDWVLRLLLHTRLPGVVAAGPLIARPDGRTEAAGIAVGLDHPAMPMLADVDAEADGYYGSLSCSRDVSAVRGDFLLVERAAFERAGGFEENYLTGYEDLDLCQRLREAGGGVVYASRPRVIVHETPAARHERLDIVDRALFVDRWYTELERGDPFYNPNFIRDQAAFAIG